jgi:uncharacterized protein
MHPGISDRRSELSAVCRCRRVRWLALFGSAAGAACSPEAGNTDSAVDFVPLAVEEYAARYSALQEDLERLFGRPVDLMEASAIREPYSRQSVEQTRFGLYEACHSTPRWRR